MSLRGDAMRAYDARNGLLFWMEPGRMYNGAHLIVSWTGNVVPSAAPVTKIAEPLVPLIQQGIRDSHVQLADSTMCELVEEAGPSMPSAPLTREEVPKPYGIVFFQLPFVGIGRRSIRVKALLWVTIPSKTSFGAPGVLIIPCVETRSLAYWVRMAAEEREVDAAPSLFMGTGGYWTFGDEEMGSIRLGGLEDAVVPDPVLGNILRSYWALCAQRSHKEPVSASKSSAKKAVKAGVTRPNEGVEVVYRYAEISTPSCIPRQTATGTRQVEWRHRQDVTHHWRKNAYIPSTGERIPFLYIPDHQRLKHLPPKEQVEIVRGKGRGLDPHQRST